MIEKSLMIIIFMYAVSISVIGGQYVMGDVFGVTLTNFEGVPIESSILGFINEDEINTRAANIVAANYTTQNGDYYNKIETFTTSAAYVAWELITLLTGTYIFNFLYLMGIPLIFVVGLVMLYVMLLARAIIGYVRGI